NLTGGEAIDILCRLSAPLDRDRKKVMLERFDLDPTKKARTYSKGNRQKVALVAALASRAQLLLLDEPTSGLDPIMEAAFTESIREVKAEDAIRVTSRRQGPRSAPSHGWSGWLALPPQHRRPATAAASGRGPASLTHLTVGCPDRPST